MPKITSSINNILFQSDNGYFVAKTSDGDTVCGIYPDLNTGLPFEADYEEVNHARYGKQFSLSNIILRPPHTLAHTEAFLAGGNFKGIGKKTAAGLVIAFGDDLPDMLSSKDPEVQLKLAKVARMGTERAKNLCEQWQKNTDYFSFLSYASSLGMCSLVATKIFKVHHAISMDILKMNPYSFYFSVPEVSFPVIDGVAIKKAAESPDPEYQLELLYSSKERNNALIHHVVSYLSQTTGSTKFSLETVLKKMYEKDRELCTIKDTEALLFFLENNRRQAGIYILKEEPVHVGIYKTLMAEKKINNILKKIITKPIDEKLPKNLDKYTFSIDLNVEQRDAILSVFTNKFSVITGGPGTGKTSIIKCICRMLESMGKSYRLAAPTGKAAKRMQEASGARAETIHRMLKWNPEINSFMYNRDNQLESDFFIIDEVSMMDAVLSGDLLEAIPSPSHVVFVGDVDQLPSVGAGSILSDLIDSDKIKTTLLSTIYRQVEDSKIIVNAHCINKGIDIDLGVINDKESYFNTLKTDCDFIAYDPKRNLKTELKETLDYLIEQGYDLKKDIQIMSPMAKGNEGTKELNRFLQEQYKAGDYPLIRGFRIGDKVIQTQNNYDYMIFNGETFIIKDILESKKEFLLEDDQGQGFYVKFTDMDTFALAYALTVHKSQGSSYPVCIFIMSPNHGHMLQRNLYYTAVTRAEKRVILFTDQTSSSFAIKNATARSRDTHLIDIL